LAHHVHHRRTDLALLLLDRLLLVEAVVTAVELDEELVPCGMRSPWPSGPPALTRIRTDGRHVESRTQRVGLLEGRDLLSRGTDDAANPSS
jgi:hypothetical protein